MSATEAPTKKSQLQSSARAAQQRESDLYLMPQIGVGQTVIYYPDRSTTEGFAAVVTQAGERAISLAIFYPGAFNMLSKDGVRYFEDPDTDIIDRSAEGVWRFAVDRAAMSAAAVKEITEFSTRLNAIAKQNNELEARLAALESLFEKK